MQAVDRRRLNPPSSQPLRYAPSKVEPLLSAATGKRRDGRSPLEVRPIYLKTDLVAGASGSAYIETGNTKLVAVVYGPKSLPPAAASSKDYLSVDVKFAPFASPRRRYAPGKDEESSALSAALHQSLLPALITEHLQRSQVDVFITILQSEGSDEDIAVGVSAASIALALAGIQMYGLVTACRAVILPSSVSPARPVLLDPTSEEQRSSRTAVSVACLPALGTVTFLDITGRLEAAELEGAMQACFKACADIHDVAKKTVLDATEARTASATPAT